MDSDSCPVDSDLHPKPVDYYKEYDFVENDITADIKLTKITTMQFTNGSKLISF